MSSQKPEYGGFMNRWLKQKNNGTIELKNIDISQTVSVQFRGAAEDTDPLRSKSFGNHGEQHTSA